MQNSPKKKQLLFDSDGTEVSDLSYESSCDLQEEDEDIPAIKKVQYFKEEMNRFFFNYPELKNNNLIDKQQQEDKPKFKKGELWASIADDILQESKNNSQIPALKAFSKRLNIYKNKVQRTEVVDLILEYHVKLLRQIDLQIQKKQKSQNTIDNSIQAKFKKETGDVNYYSWRKNKQLQFRIDKAKERARQKIKEESHKPSDHKNEILNKLNPKTEPVKSLVEDLKRCPDVLSMKKVFITFLVKYRQQIDKEFMNKPSLLQQSQKYYTQETKQFVLLYPNYQLKKKLLIQGITKQKLEKGGTCEISSLCKNNFQVLKGLTKMANGTLMSYWKSAQDRKL